MPASMNLESKHKTNKPHKHVYINMTSVQIISMRKQFKINQIEDLAFRNTLSGNKIELHKQLNFLLLLLFLTQHTHTHTHKKKLENLDLSKYNLEVSNHTCVYQPLAPAYYSLSGRSTCTFN